jgi:Spy/CpxP family protein refolding chaperone
MNASPSRPRVIGALALAAVFAAGIAVGVALDRRFGPRPGIRATFGADMSAVLDQLRLSPEQRARADAILQRRAPRTEAMMLEVADQLRAVADSLDTELRSVLTAEQRARLDSLRPERKLMLKRKLIGPGGASITDTVLPRPAPQP